MSKIYKLILVGLITLASSFTQAQEVNLQFVPETGNGVVGGNFEVLLNISGTMEYSQGGFNIRFTYDPAALGAPTIVEAYNFNAAPYAPVTLTYDAERVSVNGAIDMLESGTAVAVEPDWTRIIKMRFKILDQNKTSGLAFLPSATDPEQVGTVVFNHADGNQLQTARLQNLDASLADKPLPVSLVNFVAAFNEANQVQLQWSTASERDNKEFQVQRSHDGKKFETIATVAGAGTTVLPQTYHAVDPNPLSVTAYYRLKQIDFEGTFEFSKIVSVEAIPLGEQPVVQFGPNPFQKQATITFNSASQGNVLVTLTNLQGEVVRKEKISAEIGQTNYRLGQLDRLAKGFYLLRLEGTGVTAAIKVVKN